MERLIGILLLLGAVALVLIFVVAPVIGILWLCFTISPVVGLIVFVVGFFFIASIL